MKKLITLLAVCIAIATHTASAQSLIPTCSAGEVWSASTNADPACEKTWIYVQADRNYMSTGTFSWKYSSNSGVTWKSVDLSQWFYSADSSSIIAKAVNGNYLISYKMTGLYRVIFTKAGTNCRDTAIIDVQIVRSPSPYVVYTDRCDGITLTESVKDANAFAVKDSLFERFDNGSGVFVACPQNNTVTPSQWGSFNQHVYRVTNINGCTVQIETTVPNQNSTGPLTDTLTASKLKIAKSTPDSAILAASSNYPIGTCKWYRNNQPIVGATGNQIVVHDTGQYRVKITTTTIAGGCVTNLYKRIKYATSSGARTTDEPEARDGKLMAYPNPASGEVTIGGAEGVVQIFDNTGRMISSVEADEVGKGSLSLSEFPNGMYIIHGEDGQTLRLLVVH